MINLLSPETKRNIRAARLNVRLRKYVVLSLFVALAVFVIYGGGFYLIMTEKALADQQLNDDKSNSTAYQPILARAKAYKSDLIIAKKVLLTGVSYSSFITSTAQALPKTSILTGLTLTNLGATGQSTANANKLTLQAKSASYGDGLILKDSLEQSDLFENVSISTITKIEPTDASTELEKKYPYSVTLNVTITKQK